MVDPRSQYRYYLSLDKTVKLGAALYTVILLGGTAGILIGVERLAREVAFQRFEIPLLYAGSVVVGFVLLVVLIGRIGWIADAHALLDGYTFRLLDKANMILFHGLVVTLTKPEQEAVSDLDPARKGSLAGAVFDGLAKNNSLFTHLLRTGIFRLWIWYWIGLYGTFVFTILTMESFSLVLRGVDQYARTAFTVCWVLALAHLLLGLLLTSRLVWMMNDVAGLLVRAHQTEIASLLRKKMRS